MCVVYIYQFIDPVYINVGMSSIHVLCRYWFSLSMIKKYYNNDYL